MEVDETRQDAEEAVRHIHSNRLGHVLEADGDSRLVDWLDGQTRPGSPIDYCDPRVNQNPTAPRGPSSASQSPNPSRRSTPTR